MQDYHRKQTKKDSYKSFVISAVIIFIAIAAIAYGYNRRNGEVAEAPKEEGKKTEKKAQPFGVNGVAVGEVKRPFAVVVENHPDSRPQSGLSDADLVYEALAEGGITRFLAIYQTQDVASIGPVRSARTYFNDWASELAAVYAHVGGNSDALTELKSGVIGVSDADQFFNDPYYTRISSRRPPHNTYTSTEKLAALAEKRGFSMEKNYSDWKFKDDAPESLPSAQAIGIPFSTPQFATSYTYDPATNSYARSLAGKPAIDAGNNERIMAKNVIVQVVRNWPVQSDTPLAISMGTKEGGVARVYQDGKEILGTWKYVNGRTRYFDAAGREISLNRGVTWIAVIPPDFESKIVTQ